MHPILYLHHVREVSGAERSLLGLFSRLDRSRFLPLLACPAEGEFAERARAMGVEVFDVPFGRLRQVGAQGEALWRIVRLARVQRIRLLHSNGPQTNLVAGLAGRLLGIPAIWHARNLLAPGMVDVDRWLGFLPSRIVCNAEAIRERFRRDGRPWAKSRVVLNGVDLSLFDASLPGEALRRELGIPPAAPVAGMASRLAPDKGHGTFLEAAAAVLREMPGAHFLIAGDAVFERDRPHERWLRGRAEELGLARSVHFAGRREDMPGVYAAMDVFVLAADAEPCGRVLFEAMAMGKPVVGTASGGTPEVVADGETGFLVPPGEPGPLAERLLSLFRDPALARRLGGAGRERVEREFTLEAHARKTEAIYEEALGSP